MNLHLQLEELESRLVLAHTNPAAVALAPFQAAPAAAQAPTQQQFFITQVTAGTPFTFFDTTGNLVQVLLQGPGTAVLTLPPGGQGNLISITLAGTTAQSSLAIEVLRFGPGNLPTTIGNLTLGAPGTNTELGVLELQNAVVTTIVRNGTIDIITGAPVAQPTNPGVFVPGQESSAFPGSAGGGVLFASAGSAFLFPNLNNMSANLGAFINANFGVESQRAFGAPLESRLTGLNLPGNTLALDHRTIEPFVRGLEAAGGGARIGPLPGLYVAQTGLSGQVFDDQNGDGVREEYEPGLGGLTVLLEAKQGTELVPMGSTTTDADGTYRFPGLPPGDYRIRIVVPDELRLTTEADTETTTVPVDDWSEGVDFGLQKGSLEGAYIPGDPDAELTTQALGEYFRHWNDEPMLPALAAQTAENVLQAGEDKLFVGALLVAGVVTGMVREKTEPRPGPAAKRR